MNREQIRDSVVSILPDEALIPLEEMGAWPGDVEPPAACLAPGSEGEVAGILREATKQGWRVLPAGGGSWLGGWGASSVDLVVSTRRLDRMETYEPADLTFTAGAGVRVADLLSATGDHGQWLPLDPPGAVGGTLGALVANGVAGPLRLAYGAPRDHILGVTLVSGDGRILRWGGRVVKNVAGFDVTRLTIGSKGTLGIITSVSARLFPIPRLDKTLIVEGGSSMELLPLARDLAGSSLPISALELLEPGPNLIQGRGDGGREVPSTKEPRENGPDMAAQRDGGAALMVRLQGTEEQVQAMQGRVADAVGSGPGFKIGALEGEAGQSLHRNLDAWENEAWLVVRLSNLPNHLENLLEWSEGLPGRMELEPGSLNRAAHVGWGTLRLIFRGADPGPEIRDGVVRVLRDMREKVEADGGRVTFSHGPRQILENVWKSGEGGTVASLIRGLKHTFDPAGIMVPDRLGRM